MKMMLKIPITLLLVVSVGACNKRGSDSKNAGPVGLTKAEEEKNLCLLRSTGNSVMAQINIILIQKAKSGSTLEPYRTIFDQFKTCKDSDENCLIFWSSSLIGQLFLMRLDSTYLLAKNAELINRFDSCQKGDNLCLLKVTEEMMFAETGMSITEDGKRDLGLLDFTFNDHQSCIDSDKSCLIDRRAFLAAANLHFTIQLTYMTMYLYRIENFRNCYQKFK